MGVFRFFVEAALAGAAWLGLGLVLSDENPLTRLGLLAALLALVGGRVARTAAPAAARIPACLAIVAVVRASSGPAPAVATAALVGLGWWLQVRLRDVALALALFAAVMCSVGRPSWKLVLVFLGLGILTAAAGRLAGFVRGAVRQKPGDSEAVARDSLTSERRRSFFLPVRQALGRLRRLAGHLHSRDPREVIP